MSYDNVKLLGLQSLIGMDRAEAIKFKLMPEGHIRGFRTNRPDLPGVSELMIYPPNSCSPTITVAHCPKLLITDEAILESLMRSVKREGQ